MAYTAIVLTPEAVSRAKSAARLFGISEGCDKFLCHHVTLAFGHDGSKFNVGEKRRLIVTHYGLTSGRICAFLVKGAEDSWNSTPHLTIALNSKNGTRPVEANNIVGWVPLNEPFYLDGVVEVCQ